MRSRQIEVKYRYQTEKSKVNAVEKMNKKAICTVFVVAVLICIAYISRLPGVFYSKESGLLRAFIYLGLYLAWGISIRSRIIQKQARRYLTAIAALIVFWFLVRTIKYYYISEITHPDIVRYLWYLFYLPILFIPLMAVLVALSIGKPEDYRLPKQTKLFYIPAVALFLLVMTNDLHQLVFTFPEHGMGWGAEYDYAIGYYLVVALSVFYALEMLIVMSIKCRRPDGRRRILLPCIPICIQLVYMLLYYLQVDWLRVVLGDTTAVNCLLNVATIETCIGCGFIQANTHYMELFDASTVGAQITDEAYNVCLSSRAAKSAGRELLCRTEEGPVMLEGGIRLSGAPIHRGHVIWSEDMSPLLKVLDKLREAKENLEDSNGILEEENALKIREAHVAEQNRLYDIIQRDTARQICLMDDLIAQIEEADTDEKRVELLQKMLVIGAYLKRRSNLVLLADKRSELEAKELDLAFGESMDNLELSGVVCGFRSELTEPLLAVHIMEMYDFFEEITERALDSMSSLTVYAGRNGKELFLTVNTDSAVDFSELASETRSATRDEDGEWQLVLRLRTGGEVQ